MASTIMEDVRVVGSFDLDAVGAYPTTLPSPRMVAAAAGRDLQLIHSPRQPSPSGFMNSLNPIYTDDHDTTATTTDSSPWVAAASHDEGAHAATAARADGVTCPPPPPVPAARRHTGGDYLVELRGGRGALFAMKVMDKGTLAGRNKLARAETEREILGLLDHPFLPTLYSHFLF